MKKHGDSVEKIFITYETLKNKYGKDINKIPLGRNRNVHLL